MKNLTKKISMAAILAILIIGMGVGSTSCVSKEGQLPVFEIGNQWVYRLVVEVEDFEHNATIEVTEEDKVMELKSYSL